MATNFVRLIVLLKPEEMNVLKKRSVKFNTTVSDYCRTILFSKNANDIFLNEKLNKYSGLVFHIDNENILYKMVESIHKKIKKGEDK